MADIGAIRVVVLKEGDAWAAQCLEYDIGAQAPDLDTLRSRLTAVLCAEHRESLARHGEAFKGIPKAPSFYHKLWGRQAVLYKPERAQTDGKPPVEMQFALCA